MRKIKRGLVVITLFLCIVVVGLICVSALDYARFHRFWDTKTNQHFYTPFKEEKAKIIAAYPSFVYEGSIGYIYTEQIPGTVPLYRLWNSSDGSHVYTTNNSEKIELLGDLDVIDEGIQGYVYSSDGKDRIPLHRYFHPGYYGHPDNFYTTSESEKNKIDASGFPPWSDYVYIGVEGYLRNITAIDYSQVIIRLYDSNNSHAAFWNYEEYYTTIPGDCFGDAVCEGLEKEGCEADENCWWREEYNLYRQPGYEAYYDEIFGYPYELENPHNCDGTNKVLELYQESNSHAQVKNGPLPYGEDVCYGDLKCGAHTDPDPCPEDYKTVVRLHESYNSHVSDPSTLSYPIKICCKTNYFPDTPEVYFANMRKEKIDYAHIGDTVLLVYRNRAGSSFNFEIKENDDFFDDDILTLEGFDLNGDYAAKWTITKEDYEKGENEELQTFYFIVNSIKSNEINISRKSEGINSLPNAVITYPSLSLTKEQRRFKVGKDIDFIEDCWDEDDSLRITWEYGDGTSDSCVWPDENCDKKHSYSEWGTKEVYLRVEEIGRARKASNYTEVYVYDKGINIFPVISQPSSGSVFPYSSLPIRIYGGESYVSECEIGMCPSDIPPGVNCYTNPIDDLYCFDYPKSGARGIGKNPGQYNLWFNWTFSNGDSAYGNWVDNYLDSVNFTKYFFKTEKYKVKLKLGYGGF